MTREGLFALAAVKRPWFKPGSIGSVLSQMRWKYGQVLQRGTRLNAEGTQEIGAWALGREPDFEARVAKTAKNDGRVTHHSRVEDLTRLLERKKKEVEERDALILKKDGLLAKAKEQAKKTRESIAELVSQLLSRDVNLKDLNLSEPTRQIVSSLLTPIAEGLMTSAPSIEVDEASRKPTPRVQRWPQLKLVRRPGVGSR